MVDIDALVRRTLATEADDTPPAGGLLTAVHGRAGRLARRRRRTAVTAAVLAAAGTAGGFVAVATTSAGHVDRRVADPPVVTPATPDAQASPPAGVPPASPGNAGMGTAPPSDTAVRLGPPAYPVPVFPFQPGRTPIGGLKAPVVTLDAGELVAYYEARDPVKGADVTIRVGPNRPVFGPETRGPVREKTRKVRGRTGTLRTVEVSPANQLSLYWPETATQWVRLDTDDTLTDDEVVRLADTFGPASVPVVMPLRFDLVPAGVVVDTANPSTIVLRAGQYTITCTLYKGRRAPGLSRTPTGVTLTVPQLDPAATLVVQVPVRYPISDADLTRFGAGVHVTDRAEPRA